MAVMAPSLILLFQYIAIINSLIIFIAVEGISFGDFGKICNVTDYGAIGDNKTDNTQSIQNTINYCAHEASEDNMALIILPNVKNSHNVYLSGALWLQSNLALYIDSNVTLLGTSNESNVSYPFIYTRREGIMKMTKSSLINAGRCAAIDYNASVIGDQCQNWNTLENVIIFGSGTIDGNGDSGWYDSGNPFRNDRPCLLQLSWTTNLQIFNVTLTNSPFWTVHLLFSTNIFIENISIYTSGPNTDGIDPDSCSNVLVNDCYIESGDDCIAVKSGKNADGLAVAIPTNNVTFRNIKMGKGLGIAIGSEMSANVTNVLFENIYATNVNAAAHIKSCVGRGGVVSDITWRNIHLNGVKFGIVIAENYSAQYNASGPVPILQNILIQNMTGDVTQQCGSIICLKESPCRNVTLDNVELSGYQTGYTCQSCYGTAKDNIPDASSCLQ